MKQACIICDIDGVYMDSKEWNKFVPERHDDREGWDEFAKHINVCQPNPPIIKLINILGSIFPIIFLTSREGTEFTRNTTIAQIKKFSNGKIDLLNSLKHKLFMRNYKDYRRSFIVKEEILNNNIFPNYYPLMAIDDDKGNIEMFKKNKIGTLYYTDLRMNEQEK